MAHSKQAKKRVVQSDRARVHNRVLRSSMKTAIKRLMNDHQEGNKESAQASLALAMKRIDKCAKRNIVHRNKASRQKSQLAQLVHSM